MNRGRYLEGTPRESTRWIDSGWAIVAWRRAKELLAENRPTGRKVRQAGRTLDATFRVERVSGCLSVVIESRGGTRGSAAERNIDYAEGFELVLERLGKAGMRIVDAYVDSEATAALAPEERRLALSYPVVIADAAALKKEMGRARRRHREAAGSEGIGKRDPEGATAGGRGRGVGGDARGSTGGAVARLGSLALRRTVPRARAAGTSGVMPASRTSALPETSARDTNAWAAWPRRRARSAGIRTTCHDSTSPTYVDWCCPPGVGSMPWALTPTDGSPASACGGPPIVAPRSGRSREHPSLVALARGNGLPGRWRWSCLFDCPSGNGLETRSHDCASSSIRPRGSCSATSIAPSSASSRS